jgi:hypothetical protein
MKIKPKKSSKRTFRIQRSTAPPGQKLPFDKAFKRAAIGTHRTLR